jgi:plasmid stabilization system protein ParE
MKPIEFHPDAADEVREAAAYYEGVRAGLGIEFRGDLNETLVRIADNPQIYAKESGAIRVGTLHQFPYSIFNEDLEDRVWIAAVGHQHRRPGYWRRRRR